MRDPRHGLPRYLDSDEHAKKRHASHERSGSVDGVEYPADPAAGPALAHLLAQDAVTGEPLGDESAEQFLGLAVGDRDRGAVALFLVGHDASEMAHHDVARPKREFHGRVEDVLELSCGGGGRSGVGSRLGTWGRDSRRPGCGRRSVDVGLGARARLFLVVQALVCSA